MAGIKQICLNAEKPHLFSKMGLNINICQGRKTGGSLNNSVTFLGAEAGTEGPSFLVLKNIYNQEQNNIVNLLFWQ